MNEYEILNQYAKIKFHFDGVKKYEKDSGFPKKTVETFRKYVDVIYWVDNYDFTKMTLFFIWICHNKNSAYPKQNTKSDIKSKEFKDFLFSLKNYKATLEEDFVKLYNAPDFESLKKMIFKKEINPVSFWIVVHVIYKDKIQELKDSDVFRLIWQNIESLLFFIKLDKEYIKLYVDKLKN